MFTGIIQKKSKIEKVEKHGSIVHVSIATPPKWKLALGASVNVDGVCSTVTKFSKKTFEVDYMPETLRVTTVSNFKKGTIVNLERSLKFGDSVDGHIVQGHVEGVGKVVRIVEKGDLKEIAISVPLKLQKFCVSKGSITINGVSLTIAKKVNGTVTVALIPFTLTHTNFGILREGSEVNIETDIAMRGRK